MLLGRFNDDGEHAGRSILLDDNALSVEGRGAITFSEVAGADAQGNVTWEGGAFRTWALNRAADEGWTPPVATEPPVEIPVTAEEPKPEVPAAPKPEPETPAAPRNEPEVSKLPQPKPETAPAKPKGAAKAEAKRAAKEAKAAERAAYEAASQARIAAAAAEKAAAREAKAAAKAEAKRGAHTKAAEKSEAKAERTATAGPSVSAERKPTREGRKMLSPNARIVLGVIATLLLAIMVAISLGNPMPRKELPAVKVEAAAEAPGTTASE